ncbi:MAG: hypothetical protein ACYTFX_03335 [Planctomycetota bacterium]
MSAAPYGAGHINDTFLATYSQAGHNLDRCRAQFKLVQSLTGQEEALEQLVKKCYQEIVKG